MKVSVLWRCLYYEGVCIMELSISRSSTVGMCL